MRIPLPSYIAFFRTILCVAFFLFAGAADAQKIYGMAFQRFTHRVVEGVKAELLTTDSVVVDSMYPGPGMTLDNRAVWYFDLKKYGDPCPYIVRLSCTGYETLCFNVKRMDPQNVDEWVNMGNNEMRLLPRTRSLGEATVTATKVKFYHNGDTLVFNADAFNLAKGSMLDDLIRKMPGVRINENGEIFANGRKVESLLLNGREFFDGNGHLMLDNLPAYMVRHVQFFNRRSMSVNDATGMEATDFVMNVKLKRQYSRGWIGNVDAGGGQHERYLARLFAMCFTDRSQLAIVANVNNVNDTRKPGKDTGWTPDQMPQGAMATKMVGVDYNFKDDYRQLGYSANVEAKHTTDNSLSDISSEQFLVGGNTFTRRMAQTHTGITEVTTSHKIEKRFPGRKYLRFQLKGGYSHSNLRATDAAATFTADPRLYMPAGASIIDTIMYAGANSSQLLSRLAVNRTLTLQRLTSKQGNGSFSLYGVIGRFSMQANAGFSVASSEDFQHYLLDYPSGSQSADFRNRYALTSPNSSVNYGLGLSRLFLLPKKTSLSFSYKMNHTLENKNYALHRLERLEGWGNGEAPALGMLPSETEWMKSVTLDDNSFRYHRQPLTQELRMQVQKLYFHTDSTQLRLSFEAPAVWQRQRLDYTRGTYDAVTHRNDVMFNPYAYIYYVALKKRVRLNWQLAYRMTQTTPDLLDHLLELPYTYDPLNIQTGNANLHRTLDHNLVFTYNRTLNLKRRGLSLRAELHKYRNAIARGFTYNAETGVRTFRPQNVDGNMNVAGMVSYYLPLDRKQRLFFMTESNAMYTRSVDLITIEGNQTLPTESRVNNWFASEKITFQWSFAKRCSANLRSSAVMDRATSAREDFTTQTVWRLNNGLEFQFGLPFDFDLSTDLGLYTTRGWNDSSANTTDFVWNARLSRTFKVPNITLAVDAFDILHQLSSRSFAMNSQGRTEVYRNTMPSYVLAHVIWRFNKAPKK